MSVQKSIKYISLRDIVVATKDGYAIGFKAGVPTEVPNYRGVLEAVGAMGCVPYQAGDEKIAQIEPTFEHANEEVASERVAALDAAIRVIIERDNPVDFNRAGAPQTRSLETITGFEKVSNAERDTAWKAFKANKGE